MIIGILIGYILHDVICHIGDIIGIRKQAKVMREQGKKVEVDYWNLKILNVDGPQCSKEKAYKRSNIGFKNSNNIEGL